MELDEVSYTFVVDKLESVGTVAVLKRVLFNANDFFLKPEILHKPVHEAITIGSSTITEQEQNLMSCFWSQRNEVPEHVGIFQVGLRVSLLGVDERWEQNRITNEEDRRVVANQIPNAIVGVKLNSESSWITSSIS